MKKLPCVLLLVPHLGGGGAERVTLLLARELCAERYVVHLGLVTERHLRHQFDVPASTHVHPLGANRVRGGVLKILLLIWKVRPQIILSNMAHLNFMVLLLRPLFPHGTRVIVRQNGTVSAMLQGDSFPRQKRLLYRTLYQHAEKVICQTNAMADDLERLAPKLKGQIVVLANPVDVENVRAAARNAQSHWGGPGPHILAVGRLSFEKGLDLLLRAMAEVKKEFPAANLAIAGSGPEEASLKELCSNLSLNEDVHFLGAVPVPVEHFPGATVFVVASRHEGMPNALLEAAAAGLPIVATPASEGLVDLLNGKDGVWLAESTTAEALSAALRRAFRILKPGQRFPHLWMENFRMENAISAYEQLLDETLEKKR